MRLDGTGKLEASNIQLRERFSFDMLEGGLAAHAVTPIHNEMIGVLTPVLHVSSGQVSTLQLHGASTRASRLL